MAKQTTASSLDGLKQDLKTGTFRPCYIFWGEETYLLQHYLDELKKKLVDPLTEEFNYHRFSSEGFRVDDLWNSMENLPMMADRTMVRVDDVNLFKLEESEREKLITLLNDLPDYCCLVFVYAASQYKPDRRSKKLFDAIDKNASVVEFSKQGLRELAAWINRHFKPYKKTISPQLCQYLIEITGGTMTTLSGEIDKIASYAVGDEIRKSDIDAVVEPVLDAVVFDMTDAIGEGNYDLALEKLQKLFKMQQEPIAILGAVGAHLRRLSAARVLADHGKGGDELMRVCGMKDYPARKTMAAVKRFSARFCGEAAELVVQTDQKLKTSFDDPKRLMELLLLRLSQEAGNG